MLLSILLLCIKVIISVVIISITLAVCIFIMGLLFSAVCGIINSFTDDA